ncbi:MAG: phage tail length tape measure family protein [Mesorhizobium sp.]
MAAIAARAAKDAGNIERSFQQANDNAARGFDRSGKQVEKSLGAQRAAVANLSFQLNDISQGLLSGASPFTIMVQQGSQVAQALQGAGGGLVGAVKTLGGAFAQMVNPVSLASFAVIGLTGAAVKYFMSLRGDTKDANELLKAHAELIRSFDVAFGIAEKGAKRYSDTLKAVELQKLRDEFGNLREAIKGAADELKGDILSVPASAFGGATKSIDDMNRALSLLERDVPDFSGFAVAMSKIENSNAPASVKDLAKQFRLSAQEQIALQEAVESTDSKLRAVTTSGETVRKTFEALTAAALGWGKGGADAIDTVVNKVRGDLIPAMTQAAGQLLDYLKHFVTLQDQISRTPLGTIPPVFSGGGQFLNPDELNTFNANQGQLQAAGQSAAAQMLRGFEGFISKAKWDVNAYRVGFGSDTTTRSNGQIEKVTKDTIVTLEEAQRDLSRRIIEFQDGIQKAIGIDTWQSLSEAQQAALTSIAYNYGQLPKSIVAAINSGGGPEIVAKAIAGLSANPTRRAQEASSYLSGTGYSMASVGLTKNPEADRLREAAKAAREFEKAQKAAAREAQNLGNAVGGALKGLVDAFADGKLEAGELLDIVGRLVLQLGQMPGGFLTGSGSFLGGILGAFFHDGGVVGGPAKMKAMPASTWSGAKRYHTGTMSAGGPALMPGEIPAILQRGEVVIPKGARMGGGQSVVINAPINAPGADAAALMRVQKSVDDLRKAVPGMVTSTTHRTQVRKTRA